MESQPLLLTRIPFAECGPEPSLLPPCSRINRLPSFLLSLWLCIPSRVRMSFYGVLWKWGEKRYGIDGGSSAQELPFNLYAKYGPRVRYSEAAVMKFVAENTTIPVPIILDAVKGPRGVLILMTRVPGVDFGMNFRLHDLPLDVRTNMEDTLRDWMNQLRSLPAPSDAICSYDGSKCRSYRVHHDADFGPFPSEVEFRSYLYKTVSMQDREMLRNKTDTLGLSQTRHRICFTHGDIHPNNFLFHEGRLSAFIDWECAGWYPEYWDYTVAAQRQRYTAWCEMWQCIFPRYERELELEKEFWKVHFPW